MFALHENGVVRKSFQKPNILRRKQKVVKINTQKCIESPENNSLILETGVEDSSSNIYNSNKEFGHSSLYIPSLPSQIVDNSSYEHHELDAELKMEIGDTQIFGQYVEINNGEICEQTSLNVESFLINSEMKESSTHNNKESETDDKNKWCLNFINEDSKDMPTPSYFDASQIQISNIIGEDKSFEGSVESKAVPLAAVSLISNGEQHQDSNKTPSQNFMDFFHSRVTKFKCDMPNCNKGFWTEAKLQKHKSSHKKKSTTPVNIMCPVSKTSEDGVETKCGRSFQVRDDMLKHLNEDHTLEDAPYRCSRCGRRFFWALGMRTHEQGSCSRTYACTWPGCGRVFRQPCRLREHARVHTGDRPYSCHYPNCGWSFRSASKLMRHARRHTGERRHECGACGRAFLRREHLRDHAARHHAHPDQPCPHTGCELLFGNTNSLYMHIRKVHRKEGEKKSTANRKPRASKAKKENNVVLMTLPNNQTVEELGEFQQCEVNGEVTSQNDDMMEMVESSVDDREIQDLQGGGEGGSEGEGEREGEGRSARTHCTWPLHRAHTLTHHYEDDSQPDQPEGSESNIYTVRSDLFLHGNVLINEDSEFTINRESISRGASTEDAGESRSSTSGHIDSLGLIDSHPTIGLMQEELMYADAAVDETSFRVFLLNGEELS